MLLRDDWPKPQQQRRAHFILSHGASRLRAATSKAEARRLWRVGHLRVFRLILSSECAGQLHKLPRNPQNRNSTRAEVLLERPDDLVPFMIKWLSEQAQGVELSDPLITVREP